MSKNCYAHDNGSEGFDRGRCYHCLSVDNSEGYDNVTVMFNCVGRNNTVRNYSLDSYAAMLNCISDGGTGDGVYVSGFGSMMLNCVIMNCPAGKQGILFRYDDDTIVENINFWNNDSNSNDISQVGTYTELDPQFSDPANLDYTRTGTNLDDQGFSTIGLLDNALDYGVDIGPDQRRTCTVPSASQIQKGIAFVDHGVAGTGTLEAVSFYSPMDIAPGGAPVVDVEQPDLVIGVTAE
jgi:hypothetical protein